MNLYPYKSLNIYRNEIRLVRLLPSLKTKLRCDLVHVSLDEGLDYRALSYTWDDEQLLSSPGVEAEYDGTILVDDHSLLPIKRNLEICLRRVQGDVLFAGLIWIDALCINQADIQERNRQVLRMPDIYRMAQEVLVWLGPGDENSACALNLLRRVSNYGPVSGSMPSNPVKPNLVHWWGQVEQAQMEDEVRSGASIMEWEALTQLLGRAWWRRVWVSQEVYFAREVAFVCGEHASIDWIQVWNVLENLWAHSPWAHRVLPNAKTLLDISSPARTILYLRHKSGNLDLLKTLYHLRFQLSTDPKDKIYGALGIATDAESIIPHPDYALQMEQITSRLCESMTSWRGNLDWLTLASDHGGQQDLPSWYPDVAGKSHRVSINTSRFLPNGSSHGFCACKNSKPVTKICAAPMSCTFEGFIVDEIGGTDTGSMHEYSINTAVQQRSDVSMYTTNFSIYTAIWKTLVADQDFEGTEDSWRAPASFGPLFAQHASAAESICQGLAPTGGV